MTTIAAVRTPNGVLLACDTQSASNDGRIWPVKTKLHVLGLVDDRAVVGSSGYGMVVPAIRMLEVPQAPPEADEDALDEAVQRWAEALAADLRERHVPRADDGLIDAVQLLAWRGRVWMCTDGLAQSIDAPHTAVGSGGDLALGFLDAAFSRFTSADPARTPEVLCAAICCAARYDTSTGGDVALVGLTDGGKAFDVDGGAV